MKRAFLILGLTGAIVGQTSLVAEKTKVRVDEVPADEDTSIVIKKGVSSQECVEYELVEGKDEITGDLNFQRGGAHGSWKEACKEWKAGMKEMNRANQIITLNCNGPVASKEGDQYLYKSTATYKMKVRMREKKQ